MDPPVSSQDQVGLLRRLWDLSTDIVQLQDTLKPASAVDPAVRLDLTRQLDAAMKAVQREQAELQSRGLTLPFFTASLLDPRPLPTAEAKEARQPIF